MTKLPDCLTIEQLYVNNEYPLQRIAEIYGVTRPAVYKKAKKCKLTLRSKKQAREVAIANGRIPAQRQVE